MFLEPRQDVEGQLSVMGSGFEVLFPLVVGVYFLVRRHNPVAAAICGGWAASALASAATYIADADDGRLALLGATGPDAAGDWERILGVEFFDKVYLADPIAAKVRVFGFALWFASLGLAAWVIVRNTRSHVKAPRPAPARPSTFTPPLDDDQMWR